MSEMAKQLQLKWVQQVSQQQGDSTINRLKRERKEPPREDGQEKSTKRAAVDGIFNFLFLAYD